MSSFVGSWEGYDYYFLSDPNTTYPLSDSDGRIHLVVNANGTGSIDFNLAGVHLEDDNLTFVLGATGQGYVVFDKNGEALGGLEYTKAGSTDWLILGVPSEDGSDLVGYTFTRS